MGCHGDAAALAPVEVDSIAAEMHIDAAEIAARKAFLELTEADADCLRAIRDRCAHWMRVEARVSLRCCIIRRRPICPRRVAWMRLAAA